MYKSDHFQIKIYTFILPIFFKSVSTGKYFYKISLPYFLKYQYVLPFGKYKLRLILQVLQNQHNTNVITHMPVDIIQLVYFKYSSHTDTIS